MSGSNSQVLREFLVRIGYEEKGREQIGKSLGSITGQAAELALAFKGAAASIQDMVGMIASNLEQIYFLSQRANATAESIKAIGFAAAQVGSSVDAARGSLENLGRFLWSNPAAETFIGSLGVQTRDANGKLRETGVIMNDLIRQIRTRPPAIQEALAGILGIDVTMLRAGGAEFEKEQARYRKMLAAAHFDTKRAADDSHFLGVEWRALGGAVGILGDKISATFSRQTGELLSNFTTWLTGNFDKIVAVIEWAAHTITDFGRVFVGFAKGLWQMALDAKGAWDKLDTDSKLLLGIMAAVTAAVVAFNAVWALSPITLIGLLAAAIATLVLDYRQWKYLGAQSPIDWKTWEPVLLAAKQGFIDIGEAIKSLALTIGKVLGDALAGQKHAFDELFDAKAIKKNIEEISSAISTIPKAIEGYVKFWGGVATGNWRLALEGLQQIKDVTMGEGPPPFMQPVDAQVAELRENPSVLNRALRWVGRQFGNTNDVAHPEAATAVPTTDPAKRALAQESFNFWKARGFTDEGAGTMVAAEQRESGFNIAARGDPNALGQMTAHGSFQWHGSRRAAIEQATGINVSTASHAQQLEAAAREAELGLDPQWAAAYRRARNARSTAEAADAVVNGMLRPADREAAAYHDRMSGQAFIPLLRPGAVAVQPMVPQTPQQMERARQLPPGTLTPEGAPRAPVVATPLPPLTPNVGTVGAGPIVGPQSSISNDNSRAVALNQENNINVTVASNDGWAIGRSVLEAQRTLSQQMARDAASRVG